MFYTHNSPPKPNYLTIQWGIREGGSFFGLMATHDKHQSILFVWPTQEENLDNYNLENKITLEHWQKYDSLFSNTMLLNNVNLPSKEPSPVHDEFYFYRSVFCFCFCSHLALWPRNEAQRLQCWWTSTDDLYRNNSVTNLCSAKKQLK